MDKIFFRRKLYGKMLEWKQTRQGSTALLIKGARRVGKSTLAEQFARDEYESYLMIDFVDAPQRVRDLFDDISDIDSLLFNLQFIYNVKLTERKSVIIFDEVQNCPKARQAIRRLVSDGRFDYIETGSLISIKKNIQNIRIPSEETRMTLYPLDYEEFRWAIGDNTSMQFMREAFVAGRSLGDALTRQLMRDFRLYMLVGGMPQAVAIYLETNNLGMVDSQKREILELYADDFRKIDATGRATRIFQSIPEQLNRNTSRYQVSSVLEHGKADRVETIIQDMEDSQVVLMAYNSSDPSVGLAMHQNRNLYKMFLNDTGLFISLAFKDKDYTENIIYQKLLADKLSADLGYVYENIIAQTLKANGHELFYHTWPTESGRHNYEIDFIISEGNKIIPIEVKSSGYRTHASLDAFQAKFSDRILRRYLIYTKDYRKDHDVTLLPAFMACLL